MHVICRRYSMAMPEKRYKSAVNLRIPPSLEERLESFAFTMGWTKTDAVAVAIDHFLEEVPTEARLKALGAYRARVAAAEREKPPKPTTAKPRASKG